MSKILCSVGFSLLALYATAQPKADTLKPKFKNLDEVIVTANKVEQKQPQTGKTVTVISRKDLALNQTRSVSQILNDQAGIITNGALNNWGANQSIYVRGAKLGGTLILIDGVPVLDPSTIENNFDLNFLRPEQIERIEIVKGGQSTLYGSDAMAAVINIITRKNSKNQPAFTWSHSRGSFGTSQHSIEIAGALDSSSIDINGKKQTQKVISRRVFDYKIGTNYTWSDGFSAAFDSTGKSNFKSNFFSRRNTYVEFNVYPSKQTGIRAYYRYNRYNTALDKGSFEDATNLQYSTKSWTKGLQFNYKANNGLQCVAVFEQADYIRNTEQDSSTKVIAPYSALTYTNFYSGKSQFAEAYASFNANKNLRVLLGADLRVNRFNGFYRSFGFDDDVNKPLVSYYSENPNQEVTQFSLYGNLNYRVGNTWFTDAGVRINQHNLFGNIGTFSVHQSFVASKAWRLFAGVSSGFKAPSIYQLLDPFSGNKDLQAERSINTELGAEYKASFLTAKVTGFNREISNGIDYNYSTFKYFNYNKQTVNGVEVELSLPINKWFSANANYTYIQGKLNSQNLAGKDTTVNYLLRIPEHTFNAGLQFSHKRVQAQVQTKYVGSRNDFGSTAMLNSYLIFNVHASYELFSDWFKIYADVVNIGDVQFFDVRGYQSTPRFLQAGFVMHF